MTKNTEQLVEGSFETYTDRSGRTIRPRKGLLAYYRRANFDGLLPSGIYVKGPSHLPTVFGVVLAVRHDSPLCVLNTLREEGGVMPGDLIFFDRYTGEQASEIGLLTPAEHYNEETRKWEFSDVASHEPVFFMAEEAVIARVDGVLPDPWESGLAALPVPDSQPVLV